MSTTVRVPSASEDRPRWAVLAGIALACLAIGIGLARWGTYGRHAADGEGTTQPPAVAPETEPGSAEPEIAPEPEPAIAAEPEPAAEPEVAIAAEPEVAVAAEPEVAVAAEPEVAVAAEPEPEVAVASPPPRRTTGAAMRIVRGRVAYLRCEGVPQQSGPTPCPRDEALEAAVWGALGALGECAALPATEGEADVVLDFASATAAPEVRARDRFATDVTRLDAEAVVACAAPALAGVRQTMGSSRLVVSFRLAARAR